MTQLQTHKWHISVWGKIKNCIWNKKCLLSCLKWQIQNKNAHIFYQICQQWHILRKTFFKVLITWHSLKYDSQGKPPLLENFPGLLNVSEEILLGRNRNAIKQSEYTNVLLAFDLYIMVTYILPWRNIFSISKLNHSTVHNIQTMRQ